MYETILLPVDGSEPSNAAVDHARELAKKEDATVHVVHAIELYARSHGLTIGRVPSNVMTDVREEAEAMVDRAAEELKQAGIETETEILQGSATEVIPEYTSTYDVDLIVMGTHGRTGVQRVLLGSATERTLRTADAPVLAVES